MYLLTDLAPRLGDLPGSNEGYFISSVINYSLRLDDGRQRHRVVSLERCHGKAISFLAKWEAFTDCGFPPS